MASQIDDLSNELMQGSRKGCIFITSQLRLGRVMLDPDRLFTAFVVTAGAISTVVMMFAVLAL